MLTLFSMQPSIYSQYYVLQICKNLPYSNDISEDADILNYIQL